MRRAKIVCTIGPSSRAPDTLRTLIRAGMDVARLNLSHGDHASHAENVRRIRDASASEGRPVAILADLQGPKFRIGDLGSAGVPLVAGHTVRLTTPSSDDVSGGALPIQYDGLSDVVASGDRVLIDDGSIELRVSDVSPGNVACEVVVGGTVRSNKGVNLPGVALSLPSLTDKDLADLDHALSWDVDWMALSFVRSSVDVEALRSELRSRTDREVPVLAKIEKPSALDRLDEIIEVSDAIMVARGDLGIEIPAERVPMAQKRVIERCNDAGVPVITATQMLESMVDNPRPTRAEAADVANAVLDGTDALMLSGETTVGQFPVEAVRTMARIVCQVEGEQGDVMDRPLRTLREDIHRIVARSLAHAARGTAIEVGASAIVAITASGHTARVVSRFRPRAPILAVTPSEHVQRRLQLHWGVEPLLAPRTDNTDEMVANALLVVREHRLIAQGDVVVILAGSADARPGTTDMLRVHVVP